MQMQTMKLQLLPPSTTSLPPQGTGTQQLTISNPGNEKLRLRLKVGYASASGGNVDEVVTFDGFSDFP